MHCFRLAGHRVFVASRTPPPGPKRKLLSARVGSYLANKIFASMCQNSHSRLAIQIRDFLVLLLGLGIGTGLANFFAQITPLQLNP
jgi:hypothetical protein